MWINQLPLFNKETQDVGWGGYKRLNHQNSQSRLAVEVGFELNYFILFYLFFIEVWLLYNIIYVTGIQYSDSQFLKVILHL